MQSIFYNLRSLQASINDPCKSRSPLPSLSPQTRGLTMETKDKSLDLAVGNCHSSTMYLDKSVDNSLFSQTRNLTSESSMPDRLSNRRSK